MPSRAKQNVPCVNGVGILRLFWRHPAFRVRLKHRDAHFDRGYALVIKYAALGLVDDAQGARGLRPQLGRKRPVMLSGA